MCLTHAYQIAFFLISPTPALFLHIFVAISSQSISRPGSYLRTHLAYPPQRPALPSCTHSSSPSVGSVLLLTIRRPLRRLRQLLMIRQRHIPALSHQCLFLHFPSISPSATHSPPQLNQYRLHIKLPLPLHQARQLRRVHAPRALVHARQVDLRHESHLRRDVRIAGAAVDFQAVNPVFVDALWGGG